MKQARFLLLVSILVFLVPLRSFALISNGKNADYVLGQADFTSNTAATTQAGMKGANGLAYDSAHSRLFVSDFQNDRVLVYDVSSITSGEDAVNVLGAPDFTTGTGGTTQSTIDGPQGLTYDSTHDWLFVSDVMNNRVLVYDVASITNGENAVYVLGQSLFTTKVAATTQSGMSLPDNVGYDPDHNRLYVSDYGNNRVLVFDISSITNGQNATAVLGQATFTTATGAATRSRLNGPNGLAYYDNRLYVADGDGNDRVLVYDVATIGNGEEALYVLGQPDFTTSGSTTSQSLMESPSGVDYDPENKRLFVSETGGINRVMVFNVRDISNGQPAEYVLGQPDFVSTTAATTISGLNAAYDVKYDPVNQRIFVGDYNNKRVVVYEVGVLNERSIPESKGSSNENSEEGASTVPHVIHSTITTTVGSTVRVKAQTLRDDTISMYAIVGGKKYAMVDDGKHQDGKAGDTIYATKELSIPKTTSFKVYAVYPNVTTTTDGVITVKAGSSPASITPLFTFVYGRTPTAAETQYWTQRIAEKKALPALLGAMQWHKLFGQ